MTAQSLRPPRQERSVVNLERMLETAELLLAHRDFEALSVGDLVANAGTSVGAFYARFEDKEALFDVLYERFFARWRTNITTVAVAHRWRTLALEALVRELVSHFVKAFRAQRGLMRALVLHARQRENNVALQERADATTNAVFGEIRSLLLCRRGEIGHCVPERAVTIGLAMVLHTLRESIVVSPPRQRGAGISDDVLAEELSRALLAYFGAS